MPNFHSRLIFTALILIQDIVSAAINTVKTKHKSFKALDRYTATDFQG